MAAKKDFYHVADPCCPCCEEQEKLRQQLAAKDAEIARLRGLVEEAAKWENPDDNKYVADFINRARMAVSD